MSNISLVVALTLCVFVSLTRSKKPSRYSLTEAPSLFQKFQADYKRVYKDEADKKVHYEAFVANLKQINELHAKDSGATYGINKFADYTEEEKKQMHGIKHN